MRLKVHEGIDLSMEYSSKRKVLPTSNALYIIRCQSHGPVIFPNNSFIRQLGERHFDFKVYVIGRNDWFLKVVLPRNTSKRRRAAFLAEILISCEWKWKANAT